MTIEEALVVLERECPRGASADSHRDYYWHGERVSDGRLCCNSCELNISDHIHLTFTQIAYYIAQMETSYVAPKNQATTDLL